ncbi:uncharacterized protein LOC131336142 isoform X1 [Rhododendron vialii]|uniref:uncharacterized protein LOC131336142 isoform X1 n=1 Tax=Rhododendron vialii TaxID=182163 RepID=UPI00265ED044|nr:uncharacterized protein LOC131336142 isoform X1 [Rhododendron vialii]
MSSELGDAGNPRKWRFTWEAQSQIPTFKLLLFNPDTNTKPSTQCHDLKVNLLLQQSLLTLTWFEAGAEVSLRVPIPRVLVDPESPLQCRALDDHIEVKLVLLLPVDHPILTSLDSVLNLSDDESRRRESPSPDYSRPLSMESDVESLSSAGEVQFYCRSCSTQLTRSLRLFSEMPSTNWREVADNWFGACCCSFGGVSEKLVINYATSYGSPPGVCLLSTTFVLLCKDDLVDCKFLLSHRNEQHESETVVTAYKCLKGMLDNGSNQERVAGCDNYHKDSMLRFDENLSCSDRDEGMLAVNLGIQVSEKESNVETLSCMFQALEFSKDFVSAPGFSVDMTGHKLTNEIGDCCSSQVSGSLPKEHKTATYVELLENQKSFVNGFLGDVFMARSSNLSKDVQWFEVLCPQCSSLLGAYPSGNDHVPLDGGVRFFKCYISTCLPVGGSNDLFRKYSLERMFTNQLLENAQDELSFRTVVRDLQTRSAMLQIIVLNPSSWCCSGYCLGTEKTTEPVAQVALFPSVKVLFSDCCSSNKSEFRMIEEWVTKNEVDEVFMLAHQIKELIKCLELAKDRYPLSYASIQGLMLSSMAR